MRILLNFKSDPDPAFFHFNADPDPDPARFQSAGNLRAPI